MDSLRGEEQDHSGDPTWNTHAEYDSKDRGNIKRSPLATLAPRWRVAQVQMWQQGSRVGAGQWWDQLPVELIAKWAEKIAGE